MRFGTIIPEREREKKREMGDQRKVAPAEIPRPKKAATSGQVCPKKGRDHKGIPLSRTLFFSLGQWNIPAPGDVSHPGALLNLQGWVDL